MGAQKSLVPYLYGTEDAFGDGLILQASGWALAFKRNMSSRRLNIGQYLVISVSGQKWMLQTVRSFFRSGPRPEITKAGKGVLNLAGDFHCRYGHRLSCKDKGSRLKKRDYFADIELNAEMNTSANESVFLFGSIGCQSF